MKQSKCTIINCVGCAVALAKAENLWLYDGIIADGFELVDGEIVAK